MDCRKAAQEVGADLCFRQVNRLRGRQVANFDWCV